MGTPSILGKIIVKSKSDPMPRSRRGKIAWLVFSCVLPPPATSSAAARAMAVAGFLATALGDLIIAPIDTIKTLQQGSGGASLSMVGATRQLLQRGGPLALFAGAESYVPADAVAGGLKFFTYEWVKAWGAKPGRVPKRLMSLWVFLCGGVAFLASSIALTPGELIKQRLQTGGATPFLGAILYKKDQFTKRGSGQTSENADKRELFRNLQGCTAASRRGLRRSGARRDCSASTRATLASACATCPSRCWSWASTKICQYYLLAATYMTEPALSLGRDRSAPPPLLFTAC